MGGQVGAIDQRIRLIQHATTSDLFVFPSQIQTTCVSKDDTDISGHFGPRTFQIDYKIDSRLKEFFQIPSDIQMPNQMPTWQYFLEKVWAARRR